MVAVAMDCPPEHVIAAFADGAVDEAERERLEVHIDECPDCARVVADMARIWSERSHDPSLAGSGETTRVGSPPPGGAEEDVAVLHAGTAVGRYRVLECVGIGGMGVVYGAYDPELDRRVALKVLRGRAVRDKKRNARLLREAQAMARLAHPNVIAVYDAGTHVRPADDPAAPLVFLAMEFVRGQTLGEWVRARSRTWPELREVFVAAGRGLAAAHAAGLVHRDFKPDNVLIGEDERVRVTDFGLARFGPASESTDGDIGAPPGTRSPPIATMTETGAAVGTPAYMAPEQYGGGDVGPACDQFSFCVTLFEAAYGVRPFAGRTLAELAAKIAAGEIRSTPPGCDLPKRVHAALVRGLQANPRQRFEDMEALLAELSGERGRTLRRAFLALPLVGALVALAFVPRSDPATIAFCRPEHDLGALWASTHRDAVRSGLLRTGVSYAERTADAAVVRLDAYVEQWTLQRAQVCESSGAIAGDPDLPTLVRAQCLRHGQASFLAAVDALGHAQPSTVAGAVATIEKLTSPEDCATAELVDPPPEPPPEQADAVAEIREQIARVETLLWNGQHDEADTTLDEARARADTLGFAPLQAEVQLWTGRTAMARGQAERGAAELEEAAWSAVQARDRRLAARAFSALIHAEGVVEGDLPAARRAARAAWAELRAFGGDPWLESNLRLNVGGAEFTAGNYEVARAEFIAALESGVFEERPMSRADLIVNLGAVASDLYEFDAAIAHFEHAKLIYEEQVGPRHPAIGSVLFNIGATRYRNSDYEGALEVMQQAAAIEEETIGAQHPTHGNTLGSIGTTLCALGRLEEALEVQARAIAIFEASGDAADATLSLQRTNMAATLLLLQRTDEAERVATRGRDDLVRRLGPDHAHVSTAESLLGSIARARGDLPRAEAQLRRALEIREGVFPATHADIVFAQVELAEIVADQGRARDALALLDDILARHPDPAAAPGELAWGRFLEARERFELGEDRAAARERVHAARKALEENDELERVTKVDAWLGAHPATRAGSKRRP